MEAGAEGWLYYESVNEAGLGFDPITLDEDFNASWFDQSVGGYQGRVGYNGPVFSKTGRTPFLYGEEPALAGGRGLIPPSSGSRGAVWFLKEIDGG